MLIPAVIVHARNQALQNLQSSNSPVSLCWQYEGCEMMLAVRCRECEIMEARTGCAWPWMSSLAAAVAFECDKLDRLAALGCTHAEAAKVHLQLLLLESPADLCP